MVTAGQERHESVRFPGPTFRKAQSASLQRSASLKIAFCESKRGKPGFFGCYVTGAVDWHVPSWIRRSHRLRRKRMDDQHDKWKILAGGLSEKAQERQEAFRTAADRTDDPDLRFLFISCFFQRVRFADSLKKVLSKETAAASDDDGGLAQAVKEGVAEITSKLSSHNDRRALRRLIEEEAEFLEQYKRVLDAPLPDSFRNLVVTQFDDVLATYTRLVEVERFSEPSR